MNYDSCKMTRVESVQAVKDGAPGSFCIEDVTEGEHQFRRMWIKLPHGEDAGFNLEPAPDAVPFAWKWNFNESKPTLWREHNGRQVDLHLRGRWHGRIQNGKLVSLAKPACILSGPAPKKNAVRAAVKKGMRR